MDEKKFKHEMTYARTMQQMSSNPDYWAGYIRGLRRGYHGENFGTEEEHKLWLSLSDSPDESRQQRGRGYIDGLAVAGLQPQIGRKPLFEDEESAVLSFRIPKNIYDKIPSPRSEWARDVFLNTHDVKKL